MVQLYKLFCRNDRMMVADLLIVYKTCIGLDRLIGKCSRKFPVRTCSACLETLLNSRNYIFSYISGISSRIGKYLMVLIQSLHDI